MSASNNLIKPKGLIYKENAVDHDLSKRIYSWLMSKEFKSKLFRVTESNPKSRLVRHFGYKYDYSSGLTIKKTEDMPNILLDLRKKIKEVWKCCDKEEKHFNQCLINRYEPGQGIGAHVDKTAYGPYVVGFTFISGRNLVFSRRSRPDYNVYTKHRSMYVMTKDSRYLWSHRMDKTKSDKIGSRNISRQLCFSITFRHVPSAPDIIYYGDSKIISAKTHAKKRKREGKKNIPAKKSKKKINK